MKSAKEKAKEWCGEHSNKGCTEQCDSCWQLKQAWGCEQHNMETAYMAGANYVLDEIESLMKDVSDEYPRFQQGVIIHGRLIKLLEQLKK